MENRYTPRANRPWSTPVAAACFGFEVRSASPLALLRPGVGIPLAVNEESVGEEEPMGELIQEWEGKPGESLTTRFYARPGEDRFWLERVGSYAIRSGVPSISVPPLSARFSDPVWRESIMWGTPAAACAVRLGLMSMHAASVDIGGQALLLAAPGTFGKTTLAGAFHQAGYRLLSDDMVTYRLLPRPEIFPGPALLRLRRDVHDQLRFDGIARSHRFGRKVALIIDESRRGDAAPVPLSGVVLLRKSDSPLRFERAAPADALRDLYALSFGAVIEPARAFAGLASLVSQVPVWNLERRLEYGSLPEIVEFLASRCLSSAAA